MVELTRTSKAIIEKAIKDSGSLEPKVICDEFCKIVVERYEGNVLEYQLGRMGLETTKKVIMAIKLYLGKYGHKHLSLSQAC